MFGPDPTNKVVGIILVFSEPQLALLGNDIEDLTTQLAVCAEETGEKGQRTSPAAYVRYG